MKVSAKHEQPSSWGAADRGLAAVLDQSKTFVEAPVNLHPYADEGSSQSVGCPVLWKIEVEWIGFSPSCFPAPTTWPVTALGAFCSLYYDRDSAVQSLGWLGFRVSRETAICL